MKIGTAIAPADTELPCPGWPAEVFTISRRGNTSWPCVRVEVHDSVLLYGGG